jgi:acyl-coenzyme A synthetase/AMP-(fatty) acid ligase
VINIDYDSPLIERDANDPLALLSSPLVDNGLNRGVITAAEFLGHVQYVAERLPDGQHAINLCDNRYLFLVALSAVIVRQQTNLLPSNKIIATQTKLAGRYANSYIIHDGINQLANLPHFDLSQCDFKDSVSQHDSPKIALNHIAVISFTSGSTGEAKPNIKNWRTLLQSTRINNRHMLVDPDQTAYHLATVPGQHMWGLETSVLMALFSNVALVDARPLYPHDIATALNLLPEPRTLVSTPLHLRALYMSDIQLPSIRSVLTATAPLAQELALAIEDKYDTELREVYGCSEAGSMAVRRTAHTDIWQRFSELRFQTNELGQIEVNADHLPEVVTLEDTIELVDADHFRLGGRSGDQVKIAGKRGSLDEVNKVLVSFPALIDGVVFFPPQERTVPRLVALVILQKGTKKEALRTHFQNNLDPAFVPRPILIVEGLPREDNGKLSKAKLLSFYRSLVTH